MHPGAENPTAAHALQGSPAPPAAASGQASAGLPTRDFASRSVEEVLAALASSGDGLNAAEAGRRLAATGPNAVRTHHARALAVLARQLQSPLLILLLVTAVISFFLGDKPDAVIIGVILAGSVGLSFANEYRAERTAEALHARIRHTAVAIRDGRSVEVPVTELVPGDVVRLELGQVVPADLRLVEADGLETEESVLTGEPVSVEKGTAPVPSGAAVGELSSCALMGTVVRAGRGAGVVVATGGRTEFGRIAVGVGEHLPETDFQAGLRRFSVLLMQVAVALTTVIFVVNLVLRRPLLESLLFSLAIAVGITPQLLPAVVSTSLADGSRQLARRKVLVKRLVCIEDLGDVDVLVTDKTGTLTEGSISFTAAIDPTGVASDRVLLLGLLATETEVGGNQLDAALWAAPGAAAQPVWAYRRLGLVPFDHERRMTSALVEGAGEGRTLVTKGAPEGVLDRCRDVPGAARDVLRERFEAGERVVAVASRPAAGLAQPSPADERDLTLAGFLVFLDRPKADAAPALGRLAALGVTVKIATGDNEVVTRKVCAELGLAVAGSLTGADVERMDDDDLAAAAETATIFARVDPEHKARLIRVLRHQGRAVGFLGDGVNDALALHAADVGLSVDTGTDVAKDAADVILLEKDLDVLADGVSEGRRIFANTIKYVMMGTSSNFGNMFSAAGASLVLSFLPMLPSQILLNNLLYDSSQLTIPTDRVDPEQLTAPTHWDIGLIRRFMLFFGPISSVFDVLTFVIMLQVFHAGPALFRSGWFVESLATQTLVIFVIRTRRTPFLRSRPSVPLAAAALGVVAVGVALPLTPLAGLLGFQALPLPFYLALAAMVVVYLALVDVGKQLFFAREARREPAPRERRPDRRRRVERRASRFTHAGPLRPTGARAPS
jgi:P-type Mg2+ transporter